MTLPISIKGHDLILHCSGAMYWPARKILFISDVHLGKVTHFRKHGVALPPNSVAGNFVQLTKVVNKFLPDRIFFLGDLFHSKINNEWNLFESWVETVDANIVLVAGNHDIIAPQKYFDLGIDVVSEIQYGEFLLTHHPEEREGFFNLCGHIHPGILLQGFGRQYLELRCFFKKPAQMILPAFGEFTGKYVLRPTSADTVYAITKDDVILVETKSAIRN
ncbi:MAG: ligase-associated DNA damage response endonuclease PdeM [Flavobacterium sp.]|nr:ligase-associated DNA damage response endonuclease PdeM [Flavobacterium sp.]